MVRPGLLVVSDHGRNAVEFGSVGTGGRSSDIIPLSNHISLSLSPVPAGDSASKTVTVKNISSEPFQVSIATHTQIN